MPSVDLPDIRQCINTIFDHAVCNKDIVHNVPCPKHHRLAFEVWCVAKYDLPPVWGWHRLHDRGNLHYIYISSYLGVPVRYVSLGACDSAWAGPADQVWAGPWDIGMSSTLAACLKNSYPTHGFTQAHCVARDFVAP